ncbi:Telomerase Cajal body protein 1 [Grifola frondosa]|uniref:Telomerase Cajal body protein 1 n=1 Tax=Grifola frondosa TaxID=5627 RepID=A0A1C7MCS3_GRIFR|nr:Telomerase Cajal body protein 1 [Grifola frondosa]
MQSLSPDSDPESKSNFARVAKWCSDGSVALAQCENRSFQILQIPEQLTLPSNAASILPHKRIFSQPSPVLDFTWFPSATPRDPASFCFVASVRECPVKLLDASDGRLRASYRIVDHRERQVAPHSLVFNTAANRLYCGFEDAIEVFDVQYPGEGTRLHTTPSKKSRDGLKGIISALAFSADGASGIYAAGSLSPSSPSSSNVALFSESTGEVPVMFLGAGGHTRGANFGVRASVAQLMFNPMRPYLLYASFRRMGDIYSWDLRGDVSYPAEIFSKDISEKRTVAPPTNQRLRFDIDAGGRWLGVGDHGGGISFFDLAAHAPDSSPERHRDTAAVSRSEATLFYHAHRDAVGSVAFHPVQATLLSISGSRHFEPEVPEPTSSSDSSSSASSDENEDRLSRHNRKRISVRMNRQRSQPFATDASIKLWNFERDSNNAKDSGKGRGKTVVQYLQ